MVLQQAVKSVIIPTRDNLMTNRTLLFELVVITFSTSRHSLGIKITDIKTVSQTAHLDAVRRSLGQRLATH